MREEIKGGGSKVARISTDAEGTYRIFLVQKFGAGQGEQVLQSTKASTLKGARKKANEMLSRHQNPAELLLMGANPIKKKKPLGFHATAAEHQKQIDAQNKKMPKPVRDVLNRNPNGPRFAIRWHTGNISHAMHSEAEARKLLGQFHGKGEVIRVNPMPLKGGRRRNPAELALMGANPDGAEAARAVREGFVDAPANHCRVTDEPHIPRGDYAELGELISLTVQPARGIGLGVKEINLDSSKIKVLSSGNRRQIYFAGGDQSIGAHDLEKFTDKETGTVELGKCREIVYLAKKYHAEVGNSAAGKNVEWVHQFGEESGIQPVLCYSTSLDRLILRGGNYRVEDAGIID